MSFSDKVVIVTGASTGIGAVIAVEFAKEGANVVLVGRNEANLKKVEADVAAVGSAPLVIKASVADDKDAERIINDTVKKFGKLDVLVNNAGIAEYGDILGGKIVWAYDQIFNTNLRAVFVLTQLAAPHLVKTKGNIVNISSAAHHMYGPVGTLAYCVTKAGLNHFTKGTALELSSVGVRANVVSPGPVETNMIMRHGEIMGVSYKQIEESCPLKRGSKPIEIANAVLFLASDKAIGVTGAVFDIDNGLTVV